jgi:DNA-binding Lrp family transcriptional regulator
VVTISIDSQDRKILAALQANCRVRAQEVAEQANVSPATAWRRQRALEEAGVIRKYCAILDREKLGFAVIAFVHVTVERQNPKTIAEIEKKVRARPEVLECYATTGDADFTLRVVARDIADYDRFLQTFLVELPGIGQVRSSIALREIKHTTDLPIDAAV